MGYGVAGSWTTLQERRPLILRPSQTAVARMRARNRIANPKTSGYGKSAGEGAVKLPVRLVPRPAIAIKQRCCKEITTEYRSRVHNNGAYMQLVQQAEQEQEQRAGQSGEDKTTGAYMQLVQHAEQQLRSTTEVDIEEDLNPTNTLNF